MGSRSQNCICFTKEAVSKVNPSISVGMIGCIWAKRAVISPSGFTRRHGNTIAARIGVVRRDALDACIYE